jgi:hypothetical protein
MLGDAEGMTAGSGMADGLGDTDRLIEPPICEPKDDLLLCDVGGGFIGIASDCGVPGAEGIGDPATSCTNDARCELLIPKSGGAGLSEEMRRGGRSIFATLLCCASENSPFLAINA